MIANPDKPWDLSGFSVNLSITWENVESIPYEDWNWGGLSITPVFVGMEEVLTKAAGRY
jgi:hypothetical protein